MSRRDLSRLSETRRPRALFRKRKGHPYLFIFLVLAALMAALMVLDHFGLLDLREMLRFVLD